MQTAQDGMQAAADEKGVQLIRANSEADLTKERTIIDNLIIRDVDAIIITPFAAEGSIAALQSAVSAGIPITCFNTCSVESKRDGVVSFLSTDNYELGEKTGKVAAEFIKEHLGGEAVIGIINCDAFPEACLPRKAGFLDALTEAGVEFEVVADQSGTEADTALPIAEAILQANPNINTLWGAYGPGVVALALAVQSSGKAGEIAVFGTDIDEQLGGMLLADNNILQAVTGQAPFQLGYDAMMLTLSSLDGEDVPAAATAPTVLFDRANPEGVQTWLETAGRSLFE